MRELRHVCQSVEGALKNWTLREWESIARENKMTISEAKECFWSYLREGKLVIPFGDPCEGFDYKKGCPGHKIGETP